MSKKTAAETKKALTLKLLRLAAKHPEKRAEMLPVLVKLGVDANKFATKFPIPKEASASKVAVTKDTEDFVRWVLSTQAPMSANEVETFVSRTLGIKTSAPVKKRSGPRFQRGDSVIIKASKHSAAKFDRSNYDRFDGKVGTVTEADATDVMVRMEGQSVDVRFPGAQSQRGVGIYKYTKPYTVTGSAKIEMIYNAGGKPTPDAQVVVEAYMARTKRTEKRAANYYTGHVVFASEGGNGYYFRGFPQQRMEVDPNSEAGFQARTFNPSLGKVLYIGIFNSRPAKWKGELEKLDELAAGAAG